MEYVQPSEPEKNSMNAVIDLYKRDVDRSLLRENLKLTPEQRLLKLQNFMHGLEELRKEKK